MAPRSSRGKIPPHDVVYVVEITGWEWSGDTGSNRVDRDKPPVSEIRLITIYGKPRGPKLRKIEVAEVRLRPGLVPEQETYPPDGRPPIAGIFCVWYEQFLVDQRVTEALFGETLQMLLADRLRSVRISGTPLVRQQGAIYDLSLRMDACTDEGFDR